MADAELLEREGLHRVADIARKYAVDRPRSRRMSKVKATSLAALRFLASPQARRYEIPLALGLYEVIRKALGHP